MTLNETTYHKETPIEVINALDNAYGNKTRIRIWYGKNGKSWNEENDITGYVGRSTGETKIPLLVHNKRSTGGGGLLDHCVVKIVDTNTKRTLYQHPKFKQDYFGADDTLVYKGHPGTGEEIYATFDTPEQAKRFAAFMNGERMSK